jgi:hypothetical protein
MGSGVNSNAMLASMSVFEHERPRDISVENGVVDNGETLKFYEFAIK